MERGVSPVSPPELSDPPPTDRPVMEALLTPGTSNPRPIKFRPLSKSSWTWLPPMTPPDSPVEVSTLTAAAATVTSLTAVPTSSEAFTGTRSPGSSRTS